MIRRNYICSQCGAMRRGFASDVYTAVAPPTCCGAPMQILSSEQTEAAHRLEQSKRVDWLRRGAPVVQAALGRRRWRPA